MTITLAGQTFTVSREPNGERLVDGQTIAAFMARMRAEGRDDVLEDAAAVGRAQAEGTLVFGSSQATATVLYQNRAQTN